MAKKRVGRFPKAFVQMALGTSQIAFAVDMPLPVEMQQRLISYIFSRVKDTE